MFSYSSMADTGNAGTQNRERMIPDFEEGLVCLLNLLLGI